MADKYVTRRNEVVAELGYAVLDQVPLLGSLTKAVVGVCRARYERQFELFALGLVSGTRSDAEVLEELSTKGAEAFTAVVNAFVADTEAEKAPLYAQTYHFLAKHGLMKENPDLAKFIITSIRALTAPDVELIREIAAMWAKKMSEKERIRFFNSLWLKQATVEHFLWNRRLSVQKLVALGLLAKVNDDMPYWTTEQFDVLSALITGKDLDGSDLSQTSSATDTVGLG